MLNGIVTSNLMIDIASTVKYHLKTQNQNHPWKLQLITSENVCSSKSPSKKTSRMCKSPCHICSQRTYTRRPGLMKPRVQEMREPNQPCRIKQLEWDIHCALNKTAVEKKTKAILFVMNRTPWPSGTPLPNLPPTSIRKPCHYLDTLSNIQPLILDEFSALGTGTYKKPLSYRSRALLIQQAVSRICEVGESVQIVGARIRSGRSRA